jgi:enoyl-CoA hydratase/carnithine racemase
MTARETGTDQLQLDVDGAIAVVAFHNPAKRNALSAAMRAALPAVLDGLRADPDVRVVIITGSGDKAFMSGADISEFAQHRTDPADRAQFDGGMAAISRAWASLDKPVIAMIRGYCMGGGLLTALQADIRITADDGQFAIPAARLGVGYGFAGVTALMNLVGPAWTAEILYSARRFSAAEALQMGLVNRVVPVSDLRPQVMSLAAAIAASAPLTIAAARAAIREAARPPERRDPGRVDAMVEACFRSADYVEGQRAFIEKREPRFTGR